jgi:GMP synthase (glutamine-hydrolysing)
VTEEKIILPATSKKILILKNETREGPGIIGDLIDEYGIGKNITDLCAGESAGNPEEFCAVIVLGGPGSANDQSPKMLSELDLIRAVLDKGIPHLGICLGMQILVRVAGGNVVKCPVKELGFRSREGEPYSVELTQEGRKDPIFKGLENKFPVFHLHGETVVLAHNMELLAAGNLCRNQIIRINTAAYGIQCHFELTSEMFESWLAEDEDLNQIDPDLLREDFMKLKDTCLATGRKLFRNFLRIAGYPV